jgi:KDO2-lipid IV(A) lauroyltransferase
VKLARRRALEARAAALVEGSVARLPRSAALGCGRALGRAWAALDRRHVAIAVSNLRQAFPAWPEERALRTARGVYAHLGQMLLDIFWLGRRSRTEVLDLVEVSGREHVDAAMAAGRGAILVTGHLGNWELHGVAHGYLFGPIAVVARPLDNPELDARLCRFRSRGGNTVIYKQKALAQILRALRAGRGVAILIDQNVQQDDGIFVSFFDRPAATTTVAAAIALKTGAALIPCYTSALPDGRYRLTYRPAVRWDERADRRDEIGRLTQALTQEIEQAVRAAPEQWLWIHRRWKTQPRHEPSLERVGAVAGDGGQRA